MDQETVTKAASPKQEMRQTWAAAPGVARTNAVHVCALVHVQNGPPSAPSSLYRTFYRTGEREHANSCLALV